MARQRRQDRDLLADGGLDAARAEIRARLAVALTMDPDPEPEPATGERVREATDDTPELWLMRTPAGSPLTATRHVPVGRPKAQLIMIPGHALEGNAYPQYQAVGAAMARAGIQTWTPDPLGQGERLSRPGELVGSTTEHAEAGFEAWRRGLNPMRWFLSEIRSLVSRLLADHPTLPVFVMGHSGGGTQTAQLGAVEPRVAGAVIACSITSRADHVWSGNRIDAEQVLLGANGLDAHHLLAAWAPRPTLVLSTTADFFGLRGAQGEVERAAP
ncbi:alpha/beta hydrolase [Parenemella sanctibonifatiensis]|uniref:Serine aminopeptidase S33 domain-containing protein n=1 Tax=Parenemella sanctibonifatiensis TaxID=2016505 RepID=A0A255EAQ4_9ACTN|nr:alpha/beta hydrolase [Parenemella sanctibonifatiensis]OYN85223.1 hypothetical protein CGZ92_10425 [Parenemella sanctibonifatiensis]